MDPASPTKLAVKDSTIQRRDFLSAAATIAGSFVVGTAQPAFAFDNKISTKYDDRPKQRGSKVKMKQINHCSKDGRNSTELVVFSFAAMAFFSHAHIWKLCVSGLSMNPIKIAQGTRGIGEKGYCR